MKNEYIISGEKHWLSPDEIMRFEDTAKIRGYELQYSAVPEYLASTALATDDFACASFDLYLLRGTYKRKTTVGELRAMESSKWAGTQFSDYEVRVNSSKQKPFSLEELKALNNEMSAWNGRYDADEDYIDPTDTDANIGKKPGLPAHNIIPKQRPQRKFMFDEEDA